MGLVSLTHIHTSDLLKFWSKKKKKKCINDFKKLDKKKNPFF